ncbi:MAG: tetratricopeptide repeat protein, partial [Chitinivibrionales bacterium]|nr:tetratricopeptide repeat protein [Chitinivibrionales bacterium]
VDDIQVARVWDFFPPLGRGHQHMGFFAEDQPVAFDNLRIYQLAIPMAPSPTLVADRLWERGDFGAALEEYLGLTIDFSRNEIVRTIELRVPDCLIRLGRPAEALDRLTRGPLFRFGNDAAEAEALYLVGMAHKRMGEPVTADSLWADVCERYANTTAARGAALSLAEDKAKEVRQGPITDDMLGGLEELARRIPRHWAPYGTLHLVVLERLLEAGQVDRARALSARLTDIYKTESDLSALMLVAAARVELAKRNPKKAVEILNRCVAAHKYSQAVWEAWMLLGSVYEYDRNYRDAVTIYRKVYRECPPGFYLRWMARVRMAELAAAAAYEESRESICRDIIDSPHPFVLPRSIAQLYMNEIGETKFTDLWHSYYPDDWYFLYHLARKAVLEGEKVVAEIYLQQLLYYLQPSTWRYLRVHRLMNELG